MLVVSSLTPTPTTSSTPTAGGDLLTSQWLLLEQLQSWATQASSSLTPLTPLSPLTLILVVSAVLGSILQWWGFRRGSLSTVSGPLPPSPGRALPILGHLHLMKSQVRGEGGDGGRGGGGGGGGEVDSRVLFKAMREKLGDIFSFYAGSRLVVVLNGYDVIHEALVENAAVFSHRPHTFMSQQMGKGRGIVNTSGRHWREQRQFAERALRALGTGHSSAMGHAIQREVHSLLESLEESRCQGRSVEPGPLLQAAFSNVIISIIYGRRFELDDPEFIGLLTALNNCFENFGNTEPLNFFPAVRFLPGDPYRYHFCIDNANFLESRLVYPEIKEHERKLEETADSDDVTSDDVIAAYLRDMTQKRSKGTPTFMDKENLVKVAGDILAGGIEPPSTTAWWILLYLIHFPEVQEKCYQELLAHMGTDRSPTLDDRGSLPYLQATIMEVQRHADVGPLSMAHGLARDASLRGFRIPCDAIVLVNLHSVLHDQSEAAWGGDPEVFRPERFLGRAEGEGEEGKLVLVKRPRNFLPYSLGPRVCPGEQMARLELFLFISSILHRYRLTPHGDHPPPLKGRMALLHSPLPFRMNVERRE